MQQSSEACESVAGPVDMSRIREARSIMIDRLVAKRDMNREEEGRWVGKSSRRPAARLKSSTFTKSEIPVILGPF